MIDIQRGPRVPPEHEGDVRERAHQYESRDESRFGGVFEAEGVC